VASPPPADPAVDLDARVGETIRRHGLLGPGDTVLVAVSGGSDSVALLDVLRRLAPALDLRLHVIHVHHGLRPEADGEAAWVADLCARWGVPCRLERVHVAERRHGARWPGPEGAAREARHAAFGAAARRVGARRIATGHTADDQAETVLMRLLQGAGPRGLAGIAPVRGPYVRPLLEVRRAEVRAHLAARGLSWLEDPSNRDPAFLRNRLRHEVLPWLEEALGPDVAGALARGGAVARAALADLESRARAILGRVGRPVPRGLVLPREPLAALPRDLALEVLRGAALRVESSATWRGAVRRRLAGLLAAGPEGAAFRLGAVSFEASGDWLRVGAPAAPIRPRRWRLDGMLRLDEAGLVLAARRRPCPPGFSPSRDPRAAIFDAGAVPDEVLVRGWRPGDRLLPLGERGPRSLKGLLAHLPRWERRQVPVLEADGEILWAAGVRRGSGAPVTAATHCILEVTLASPLAEAGNAE
jgi:tRNA(Ile)-lysidine synthase